LLLKVARVVSSFTISAVPAGTGDPLCATEIDASSKLQGRTIHFFITPPQAFTYRITLDYCF